MVDTERFEPDRELFGQGLANLVSPLFGGMPATGAIARTAVNVRAGARTRFAAVVHAAFLLLVVLVAGPVVARIPLAALAGVLMVTGVRMVEIHNVRAVVRATRSDAAVLVSTMAVTLAFDLIRAVEVGIAVAAVLALRSVARTGTATAEAAPAVDAETERDLLAHHIVSYRIDGAVFFGAAQRFLTELTAVTDVDVAVLRLEQVQVLDATGASALGEIISELEGRGVTVLLSGARPEHGRTLAAVGALDRLPTNATGSTTSTAPWRTPGRTPTATTRRARPGSRRRRGRASSARCPAPWPARPSSSDASRRWRGARRWRPR